MLQTIKLYFTYVGMYFRSRMEYRATFFFGSFSNFYYYLIVYATLIIMVHKFGTINGWNYSELILLYSFNLIAYAISGVFFWQTIFNLESKVTSGEFDRFMLRPVGIITQLVCQEFGYVFLGQIVVCMFFLIPALVSLHLKITLIKVLFILYTILGGVMFHAGVVIIIGSLSFWLMRSTQIGWVVYYDVRNFTNYPVSIYPNYIKFILTFLLPWAIVNYYPSLIILNKFSNNFEVILGTISPLIGVGIFVFSQVVFKLGLRRYSGTGS